MNNDQTNYETIQDEHLDNLIRLAYMRAEQEAIKKIIDDCDNSSPEIENLSQSTYKRFLDKLSAESKENRNASISRIWKSRISKIINIAACVVLVLGLATPFAVANVDSIRVKVMELLITIENDHTALSLVVDEDASFDIPAGWNGFYYPSCIPEGYTIVEQSNFINEVTYENAEGSFILFGEYTSDQSTSLDSEHAELRFSTISGHNAYIILKDEHVTLAWSNGMQYFIIYTNLSLNEAFPIAESLVSIRK